ncbi:MAG: preprotein translocase subunit SecY [Verrucomicrobiota bacterium]
MFSAFSNCFKIPELRQRILYTLCMIVIVRIGAAIPCPGVNSIVLGKFFETVVDKQGQASVVGLFNLFSGGALENCALFSLGIMPYISASIMMQLMVAIMPQLGKLAREEGGRVKINQYTRLMAVALCAFQGYMMAASFENPSKIPMLHGIESIIAQYGDLVPHKGWLFRLTTVMNLAAGTMFLMWLGDQITEKGIGNGISVIITVGILARLPSALVQLLQTFHIGSEQGPSPLIIPLMLLFLFGVIAATIAITQAQRKIPVQYAKQVRGNRIFGGQSSFLPLKVNYSGVMPIIFAQSLLIFPSMIIGFLFPTSPTARHISDLIVHGWLHYALYVPMILFFAYFWVATQFNPVQISDELKKNGGFIPGVRPGQGTAQFLEFSMTRLTLAGAIFLIILAILPMSVQSWMGVPSITAQFFGGTSLLIMVGVVLDTMRQMETYLLQRHYDGFLKKGKIRGRSVGNAPQAGAALTPDAAIWLYAFIGMLVIAGVVLSLLKH